MGIKACYISREQDNEGVRKDVVKGRYQIVTPEMIVSNRRWREMLIGDVYTHQLRAFIVDEAHTVKKWYIIVRIAYKYN